MSDRLPALDEGLTSSEALAQHLNALHTTGRVYIETEANERILGGGGALRGNISIAYTEHLSNVCYYVYENH